LFAVTRDGQLHFEAVGSRAPEAPVHGGAQDVLLRRLPRMSVESEVDGSSLPSGP
jgi:hypothetical protein